MGRSRRWFAPAGAALAILGAVTTAAGAAQPAIAIPSPLEGPLKPFAGTAAAAQPLRGPWRPANPALAPDGRSGTGLAAGNGAASPLPGPLGEKTSRSSSMLGGTCGGLALDARDRVLAVCNLPFGPVLALADPSTLGAVAEMALPPRPSADRADTGGGTHFLVRADGTLLVPTNRGELLHLGVEDTGFRELGKVELGGSLAPGERLFAVGAGYDGYDWVTGAGGTVMTVPRDGRGRPRALRLGEPIAEDLATDPTGTFVVTRDALYRLEATDDGTPRVVWRQPLAVGRTDEESGRIHLGSGTPPAMIAGGYVAVADGNDPPSVTVVRVAGPSRRRLACAVPVFRADAGSVEAQLAVAGRSLVVANAYGYKGLFATEGGRTTTGGITRIIVGKRGCRVAWTSPEVSPSANAVVSRATGLLYTVIKPAGFPDEWRMAALDWRTGAVRFSVLAGEGLGFNSDGGAMLLGPDGAAYAGSFGGVSRWKDG